MKIRWIWSYELPKLKYICISYIKTIITSSRQLRAAEGAPGRPHLPQKTQIGQHGLHSTVTRPNLTRKKMNPLLRTLKVPYPANADFSINTSSNRPHSEYFWEQQSGLLPEAVQPLDVNLRHLEVLGSSPLQKNPDSGHPVSGKTWKPTAFWVKASWEMPPGWCYVMGPQRFLTPATRSRRTEYSILTRLEILENESAQPIGYNSNDMHMKLKHLQVPVDCDHFQ